MTKCSNDCSYCGDVKTVPITFLAPCPRCQTGGTVVGIEVRRAVILRRKNHPDHVSIFIVRRGDTPDDGEFTLGFQCAPGKAEEFLRDLGIDSSSLIEPKPNDFKFSKKKSR